MRDMGESDVATTYSACHQYHAESSLIADPSPTTTEAQTAHSPISIPPDLVFTLQLTQPIDTDTAAAGDVVVAKVSHVGPPDAVIPEGSTVRGRIVRMLHLLDHPRSFVIAIQIETVEIGGYQSPLYAIRQTEHGPSTSTNRSRPIFLPQAGQSRFVCNFSFFTNDKRRVMPRGYETQWITVAAPAQDNGTEPRP
jgi:hypothetical protein